MKPVVPRLMTAARLVLGAAALVFAMEGEGLVRAATLITISVVIGGLGAWIARWVEAASPFGVFFDSLTDYLALIVAPWVLTRAILIAPRSLLQEVLLDLPLMTGAIRCARDAQFAVDPGSRARNLRGLDPVFFAFVSVTAVFLRLPELVAAGRLTTVVIPLVAVLSVLMVVPVRYPRLTAVPGLLPAVLVLLAAMPFVQTEILAAGAILLGLLFVLVAPLFAASGHD